MPKASEHSSAQFVKTMYVGNSGSGKTGSLASLVAAGYKLKIIDLDHGLDILINIVKDKHPELLDNIEFQSFRNKTKMSNAGPVIAGSPTAFTGAVKAMDKWEDDSDPAEWGEDTIMVVDSLTTLGREAYLWAKAINPTSREKRQWYMGAQEIVEDVVATLTSDSFKTNVIVISHIDIRTQADNTIKGFPSAIGAALGPKLPRYFNSLIMAETIGTGANVKRQIKTVSTPLIDLKTSAPMRINATYPIETGMADVFKALKSG